MGNCQTVDAATAVIHHPNGGVERLYWSTTASRVMDSNPGHYVAVIVTANEKSTTERKPVRYLKLLRPDDALVIGQVYRLVSFEGSECYVVVYEFTPDCFMYFLSFLLDC